MLGSKEKKVLGSLPAIALPDCPSFTRSPPTVTFTSGLEDNKSYFNVKTYKWNGGQLKLLLPLSVLLLSINNQALFTDFHQE